jgi:hypothetical protein
MEPECSGKEQTSGTDALKKIGDQNLSKQTSNILKKQFTSTTKTSLPIHY